MDQRHLEMTVLMTPDMANFSGKVHGGALLNLLDRVAFSCASRYSGRYAVTLSVDQVTFKEPINVGELVTFRAVNHAGRTSMEVGIRVEAENIRAGTRRHTNSCYFTMVAVDNAGRPAEVPALRMTPPPRRAATARLNFAASSGARSPPSWSGPRRARHEHLVLGRHRPRHRPGRLRPPDATVIGDVIVAAGVYVGPQCVLRGDFGRIEIRAGGERPGDLRRPHLPEPRGGRRALRPYRPWRRAARLPHRPQRHGRDERRGHGRGRDRRGLHRRRHGLRQGRREDSAAQPRRRLARPRRPRAHRAGDRLEDARHRRLPAPRRSRPGPSSPPPNRSPPPSPAAAVSAPPTTTR